MALDASLEPPLWVNVDGPEHVDVGGPLLLGLVGEPAVLLAVELGEVVRRLPGLGADPEDVPMIGEAGGGGRRQRERERDGRFNFLAREQTGPRKQ